jgi:hypothetical protein
MSGSDLCDFFQGLEPGFWHDCDRATQNGISVVPASLPVDASLARIETIRLTVNAKV